MNDQERNAAWKLLAEIDALREALGKLYTEEGTVSQRVLHISQELDVKICLYLQLLGW